MGQRAPINPRTILIVEDEVLFRLELADLFEASGYRVLEAGDADEAIAVLDEDPSISIVLTDIQMPGRWTACVLPTMFETDTRRCRW